MDMHMPPALKPGNTIGITCPAGYVSHERVAYAMETLQQWGYQVMLGKTVGAEHHYFSGTDDERLADLQRMLDDPGIKAILMGRGGYGVSRIIDALDFTRFQQSPKWICGFSDITVLHSHISACFGMASLHSPMCGAFKPEAIDGINIQSLRKALLGEALSYSFPASKYNRAGSAEGIITGGNLAILAHLTGSRSQVNTDGEILFIEDIGEHLYQIDRMMLTLKRSGQLSNLAGLLVGSFTDTEDTERPFGQTVEALILDKVAEYNYPVAFQFPCGHGDENVTLRLGTRHKLHVTDGDSTLTEIL